MHIHVFGMLIHTPRLGSMSCPHNSFSPVPLPPPAQALKLLRTAQFRPLVIFIKAASPDGVRRLHSSARVDNKQGHSLLTVRQTLSSKCTCSTCTCTVYLYFIHLIFPLLSYFLTTLSQPCLLCLQTLTCFL